MKYSIHIRAAVLTLAFALALILPTASYAAEPIKIGVLWGLSGYAAVYTKPAVEGMKMAVDEINARGGVLDRPLKLIVKKTKLKPGVAVKGARSLILKEKVNFLAGAISDAEALAVSEVARENEVLFLSGISQTAALTGEKGHRYVARTTTNTTVFGRSGAIFAKDKPWTTYYTIGPDHEYGHRVIEDFIDYLEKLKPGGEFVGEAWPKLGEGDFGSYITAIMEADPDVVISSLWGEDAIAFIKQAKTHDLFEEINYMNFAAGDLDVVSALEDEMPEGIYASAYYLPYFPATAANISFAKEYKKRRDEYAGNGALSGYNVIKFLAAAIEKAETTDTDEVIDALRGMTLNTPIGPITIREFDGQSTAPYMWGTTMHSPDYPFAILKNLMVIPGEEALRSEEEIMEARE